MQERGEAIAVVCERQQNFGQYQHTLVSQSEIVAMLYPVCRQRKAGILMALQGVCTTTQQTWAQVFRWRTRRGLV